MSRPTLLLAASFLLGCASNKPMTVYFGTYTSPDGSRGIYRSTIDPKTGALAEPRLAAETPSPSFLAIHSDGKHLFAVNELEDFGGEKTGAVSAFAIEPSGDLRLLNQLPTRGAAPCYVSVARGGKHILVANYTGGSVATFGIGADGKLATAGFVQHEGSGAVPGRQGGPHAHSILEDPEGRRVFAADLGLDKVLVYRLDPASGSLTPNDPPSGSVPPGGGPRHLAFHPSGRFLYANDEITLAVTAFAHDPATGSLTELQTLSTVPEGTKKGSTAQTLVSPDGRFLYVSNRGHDSIAMFAIDQASGKLTPLGHEPTQGKTPRNFNIDPTGTFVLAANQGSDTIVVFRIDPATGRLHATGHTIRVPKPVCVTFLR